LNLARTMPMVRTILPPHRALLVAEYMLDTGAHLERVVFADFWRSASGRLRAARRLVQLERMAAAPA
jgi:hypothetical protein